jgi:hypothetical protein
MVSLFLLCPLEQQKILTQIARLPGDGLCPRLRGPLQWRAASRLHIARGLRVCEAVWLLRSRFGSRPLGTYTCRLHLAQAELLLAARS